MHLPEVVYEDTIRTEQGTFWLRPDPECRAIVEGVLGKALQDYPDIWLHAYDAQSTHLHLLFSAGDAAQIPLFLDFVHGNIARQVNQLRQRSGRFWSRRGAVIAVLDAKAEVARFGYVLAQGTAAGLVASPKDWPGASSTAALLGDMRVTAHYTSLDQARRNARRAHPRPAADLAKDVSFALTPLPTWSTLSPAALRAKHVAAVATIERTLGQAQVLGAAALRRQSPHRRAKPLARSPIPRCHASSRAVRKRYDRAYRAFSDAYARAADLVRRDPKAARTEILRLYPPGSLARPGWYIKPPERFQPPWLRGTDDVDKSAVRLSAAASDALR